MAFFYDENNCLSSFKQKNFDSLPLLGGSLDKDYFL